MKIKYGFFNLICIISVFVLVMIGIYTSKDNSNLQMTIISLEEFQSLMDSKNSGNVYIYVGRDSCPSCTLVYPSLCEIKDKIGLDMFYYSTEPDRDTRTDELNLFLSTIGVDYVPSVVVISSGTIQSVVDGEIFIEQYLGAEG